MSDIIIKGMGMLPEGYAYEVIIRGNGDVLDAETGMKMGTAVELPQHGRLGDLDKAIKIIREASEFQKTRAMSGAFSRGIADGYDRVIKMLESTETVLEASKEESK